MNSVNHFTMGTAKSLLQKFQKLDVDRIALKVVEETKDEYKDWNLEQMMSGKTKDGSDITPSYLNDPYFKSPEAAQRYSDWKDRIQPYATSRRSGTPNLYINGRYHNSIRAEVDQGGITLKSSSPDAPNIERKFGREIYGIGGEFKKDYLQFALRPEWKKEVESATGLKLSR